MPFMAGCISILIDYLAELELSFPKMTLGGPEVIDKSKSPSDINKMDGNGPGGGDSPAQVEVLRNQANRLEQGRDAIVNDMLNPIRRWLIELNHNRNTGN